MQILEAGQIVGTRHNPRQSAEKRMEQPKVLRPGEYVQVDAGAHGRRDVWLKGTTTCCSVLHPATYQPARCLRGEFGKE